METVLFPLIALGTLVKDHLSVYMTVYFWVLYSMPLVSMPVFMLVPHCLIIVALKYILKLWTGGGMLLIWISVVLKAICFTGALTVMLDGLINLLDIILQPNFRIV